MAPLAAYDEIAEWYEHDFQGIQRDPGSPLAEDTTGIISALEKLLGRGPGR